MNRIGRYEICGRLGRGAMSTVYKARAPVTDRIVALKVLKPRDEIFEDLVGWERLRELFVEEARIMGAISHDHVAKIIDCDQHDGVPFIVLEYFSHSLGDFIGEAYRVEEETRTVDVSRAAAYAIQTLKGLERLHFAGVIHRDIKPYNMMITNDDRVKLIDFGLSRVRGEQTEAIPGLQVGSPYYAAPEQGYAPGQADARADLFSVGVLLYRMLTGTLPDPGSEPLRPASELNLEVDEEWDDFLVKALARRPEARFPDAVAMRVALESLYERWQSHAREACPLVEEGPAAVEPGPQVRSEPIRIMYKEIREMLNLDHFFRPQAMPGHALEVVNTLLLRDPLTGLLWQRSGSGFLLDWRQAKDYVAHLNEQGFQGRATWRLPTAAELTTILRPPGKFRDFCLDPGFDRRLHWLWSADHCTVKQAWMADIVGSYLARQDIDGSAAVCAVSR